MLLTFVASCSSTTQITSSDKDAKIYVDGQFRGTGSVSHTDTKIVGSQTNIVIQKKGCEPRNFTMYRSEVFDAGACAGGVFVLAPFLWIMKYNPTHSYEYECVKTK
jgi:hypothetical protein